MIRVRPGGRVIGWRRVIHPAPGNYAAFMRGIVGWPRFTRHPTKTIGRVSRVSGGFLSPYGESGEYPTARGEKVAGSGSRPPTSRAGKEA